MASLSHAKSLLWVAAIFLCPLTSLWIWNIFSSRDRCVVLNTRSTKTKTCGIRILKRVVSALEKCLPKRNSHVLKIRGFSENYRCVGGAQRSKYASLEAVGEGGSQPYFGVSLVVYIAMLLSHAQWWLSRLRVTNTIRWRRDTVASRIRRSARHWL